VEVQIETMSYNTIRTNTISGAGNFRGLFQSRLTSSLISLFCGLWLTGETIAQDLPATGDVQLTETLSQLLGQPAASRYQKIIPPEEQISWEVYVPENSSTEKPGVFVYVSPRKTGQIDSRWRTVMDHQNLIYISANDSGNRILVTRRMVLATTAIKALAQGYSFSVDRIYVAGFSGGGRVASFLASQYPAVFTGAIYICGVDFWKKDQTPNVERVLQNRFVFLTGTKDFNRKETSSIYRRYLKAGAQHSKLMVIPGMAHAHPDAPELTEALQFLNGQVQP
jgi:predicted esterase